VYLAMMVTTRTRKCLIGDCVGDGEEQKRCNEGNFRSSKQDSCSDLVDKESKSRCETLKSICNDSSYTAWMKDKCERTCCEEMKEAKIDCSDKFKNCEVFKIKQFCQLPQYENFVRKNCRKTCNYC